MSGDPALVRPMRIPLWVSLEVVHCLKSATSVEGHFALPFPLFTVWSKALSLLVSDSKQGLISLLEAKYSGWSDTILPGASWRDRRVIRFHLRRAEGSNV